MINHRQEPRCPADTPIRLESGHVQLVASLTNISLSGLGVSLSQMPPSTEKILVSFRLPATKTTITTWCVPIWQAKAGGNWLLGLKFAGLDSAHYSAIADFIADAWQSSHTSD